MELHMELRLNQTIRNLTCVDLEILLVVIRLGVTVLKKAWLVYLLDLFEERAEEGWYDLVCVKCLSTIGLMVVLLMPFSHMMSMVLVLWRFKDKIMLYCFREVKYQQSYTSEI